METYMSLCNVLCFFLLSFTIAASAIAIELPSRLPSCHPGPRDASLHLWNSFSITGPHPIYNHDFCMNTSYPKTASWREDEDRCSWEGVVCDDSTGVIVGLDLSCARLRSAIDSRISLFSLRHLRSLSLAGNDCVGSSILPEISVFSRMTHLNLISLSVSSIVPTEISRLLKLVYLVLSGNELEMQNQTMRTPINLKVRFSCLLMPQFTTQFPTTIFRGKSLR